MLRYVSTAAGDFGEHMVSASHTAVETGRNDAAPPRLARLRALDTDGRACDTPEDTRPPTSSSPATSEPDTSDDDDHVDVPVPAAPNTHSGHSGHPCRPGERDGDHDGYCGEGR